MDPVLLTATRTGANPSDAEPVLVDLGRNERGDITVTLTLDDTSTLTFMRTELVAATTRDIQQLADAA